VIRNSDVLSTTVAHEIALSCLHAGIRAAHPTNVLDESTEADDGTLIVNGDAYELGQYSDVVIVGGGNAAGQVAAVLDDELGESITDGVVVTDDPAEATEIDVLEGTHPIPDERGVESTRRMLDCADAADEETLVIAVITGGGSALLPAPAGDLTLADLQSTTEELLASGATIHEINAVRKHLSDVKGGQLARASAPARVVGLAFSDVIGNDLSVIASGPITPDASAFDDAAAVLKRYDVAVPEAVRDRLERGVRGVLPETPDSDCSLFDRVDTHVLADGFTALDAAQNVAQEQGYDAQILSSGIRGEAREAAKTHVAIAEEMRATGNPVEPPAVVLSGGETTVTITGSGSGGPNQEFALSAALELGERDVVVASVDTDGIDGSTDAAGAVVDSRTCAESTDRAREALANNDAYPYLDSIDALVETGATGTNVNDLRVIVVEE
jgi:hydroxypyruvate reductase